MSLLKELLESQIARQSQGELRTVPFGKELSVSRRLPQKNLKFLKEHVCDSLTSKTRSVWAPQAGLSKCLVRFASSDYQSQSLQWPLERLVHFDGEASIFQEAGNSFNRLAVTAGASLQEFRTTLEQALAVPAGRIGNTGSGVSAAILHFARRLEHEPPEGVVGKSNRTTISGRAKNSTVWKRAKCIQTASPKKS